MRKYLYHSGKLLLPYFTHRLLSSLSLLMTVCGNEEAGLLLRKAFELSLLDKISKSKRIKSNFSVSLIESPNGYSLEISLVYQFG